MKPTGQTLPPKQYDNETLAEAIRRYEWGKLTEKLIKEDNGRMKIEGGSNEPKI